MVKEVSEMQSCAHDEPGDEMTTIAAKLLGTLENVTQQTVHAQGSYDKNARISKGGGRLKVVMCGAFCQPHPV